MLFDLLIRSLINEVSLSLSIQGPTKVYFYAKQYLSRIPITEADHLEIITPKTACYVQMYFLNEAESRHYFKSFQ